MKIIEQSAKCINEKDPLKKIELIARACYKSENLIKGGSAEKFVKGLTDAKHYAMLEHAIFHFEMDSATFYEDMPYNDSKIKKYAEVSFVTNDNIVLLTINLRTIFEVIDKEVKKSLTAQLGTKDDFEEWVRYKKFKRMIQVLLSKEVLKVKGLNPITDSEIEKYIHLVTDDEIRELYDLSVYKKHHFETYKFVTNRAIANEIVRHRACSFAQESTRYCNYSKDKFGNEIKVIEPYGLHGNEIWRKATECVEKAYFELLKVTKPEIARDILPLDLATELTVTANLEEWEHILDLRYYNTTGKAHPQVVELMGEIFHDLSERILDYEK